METNPLAAGSGAQEKGRSPRLGRLFERPAVLFCVRVGGGARGKRQERG